MYKVKTYNEHQIRAMLQSGKMQYENFYKDELITFLKFSTEENKKLKEKQEDFTKWLEDKINELSDIICEDSMNRISTTYEEAKKVVYQEALDKFRSVMNEL